jgi:hypothetical protein
MRVRKRERTREPSSNDDRSQSSKQGSRTDNRGDNRSDNRGKNRGKSRGKSNKNRNRSNRNRRGKQQRKPDTAGFWGDPTKLPEARSDVRITDDPAAVPRSLGPPPLPGHEKIAEHYFAAVYDRAVMTAGALAAAGGLIDPESLTDE